MTYKEILTFFNSTFYNWMYGGINNNCVLCSNEDIIPRGFGKTTILNEIGLLAQAMGKEVLIWTPYNNTEYYATEKLEVANQLRRHHINNGILLIDEIDISDIKNYNMLRDLDDSGILTIGFIRGK